MQDLLKYASALVAEAASRLEAETSPEKRATELVDDMVDRGIFTAKDRDHYIAYYTHNPEKMASLAESITALPEKSTAIADIAPLPKTAGKGRDAWDAYFN